VKDAKIYDGAGWQSLKGPPGPSMPSADAGNALTTGSDGLLMYREPQPKGDVQFSGEWIPISTSLDNELEYPEGYWTRVGDVVTVTVGYQLNRVLGDQDGALGGLPFSVAEFFSPTSGTTGQWAAPVIGTFAGVVGWVVVNGQEFPDQIIINMRDGYGTRMMFTLTYITDDARIG